MSALSILAVVVGYGCARNDQQARAPSGYDNTGMAGSTNPSGAGTTTTTASPAPSGSIAPMPAPTAKGGGPIMDGSEWPPPAPGEELHQDMDRTDGGSGEGGPGLNPDMPGEGNNRYDAGMMP
jgi:hypothetical protein